jgi:hypothetical protein
MGGGMAVDGLAHMHFPAQANQKTLLLNVFHNGKMISSIAKTVILLRVTTKFLMSLVLPHDS